MASKRHTTTGWTHLQDIIKDVPGAPAIPPPRPEAPEDCEAIVDGFWMATDPQWSGSRFAIMLNGEWSSGQEDLFGGVSAPQGSWPKRCRMTGDGYVLDVTPWPGRPDIGASDGESGIWRTPNARDYKGADPNNATNRQIGLNDQVKAQGLMPTPTSSDCYGAGQGPNVQGGESLNVFVHRTTEGGKFHQPSVGRGDGKLWATPQNHDGKTGSADRISRDNGGGCRNLNDEIQAFPATAVGNLPTPKAGSNRNSRKAIMGGHPNHPSKSDLSLEQAVECIEGILPREVKDPSELPSRFQALFPTPTGTERAGTNPNTGKGGGLSRHVKDEAGLFPTPRAGKVNGEDEETWRKRQENGGVSTPPLGLAVKLSDAPQDGPVGWAGRSDGRRDWPTPRSSEYKGVGPVGSKSHKHMLDKHYLCAEVQEAELGGAAQFPTPRGGGEGVGLCGGTGAYEQLKGLEADGTITEDERRAMANGRGGQLNPDWVEPLMGYRCGTTRIEPAVEPWLKVDSKRLKAADLKKLHDQDDQVDEEEGQ